MPRKKASTGMHLSGFVLEIYLLERYGPRLSIIQLMEVLQMGRSTAFKELSAGTFPVHTYLANGARYADYRDVAKHLDQCRLDAQEAAEVDE